MQCRHLWRTLWALIYKRHHREAIVQSCQALEGGCPPRSLPAGARVSGSGWVKLPLIASCSHSNWDPVTSLGTMRQHGIVTQSQNARTPASQFEELAASVHLPQALPSVPFFPGSFHWKHSMVLLA